MKFTAIFAAVAAATLASAQGYNDTHSSNTTKPYDARTVSVPAPSHPPTTALTSIYTITSNCGSVTIFRPSTSVIPLNNGTARTATYSGTDAPSAAASNSARSTGGASLPTAAAGMGFAGIAGLAAVLAL